MCMPACIAVLTICAVGSAAAPLSFSPELASGGGKAPLQLRDGSVIAARYEALPSGKGVRVGCYRSADMGKTWQAYSIIAQDDDPRADIGDGHLMMLATGDILYSYRRNHVHGRSTPDKSFSIEVAVSRDQGKTWQHHSTVASAANTHFGLWSSFLLQRRDGALQCYYDDEQTPSANNLPRHQWITMKTWNARSRRWENPVTVSRAGGDKLSRDGMCSVVEVSPGHLICACEGVQEAPPHRGCLYIVESADGGRSWSGRGKLYEPKNTDFNALAPWMVRFGGLLVVVFTTDEDRKEPTPPHTGELYQDLKCITSADDGKTWSGPWVIDDQVPDFYPGACVVWDKARSQKLLVQYSRGWGHFCRLGELAK